MPVWFNRAVIDPTGKYRYLLTRNWASDHGRVCFIMLNPSTADAEKDDPTIRSCVRIARHLAGSLCVVNLFAFRATDQKNLIYARDPVGPENDRHIIEAVRESDIVIAAWGVERCNYRPRAAVVRRLLLENSIKVRCLGFTKTGSPRHPLFMPGTTQPQPYKLEGY